MKKRVDLVLVAQGLAPSRERAQSLILAGKVLNGDTPVEKSGQPVEEDAPLRLRGEDHPYVSRGGIKLAHALEKFQIDPAGRVGLDVGASTGGFTQVLLLNGAIKVHAIDVGHNQLDWKMRNDPRVHAVEKINARNIGYDVVGETVGIIVIDVSFISLEKILPSLIQFSTPKTDWITLIKPQFEVGKEQVGKGGIVTSFAAREEANQRLIKFAETLGLKSLGLVESPITGTHGNIEFLAHWRQI
jgi:23S rRNA (cytidine1920-2'-O)/16S rRNA (cytidine1409-2'-O)-methyltransferase